MVLVSLEEEEWQWALQQEDYLEDLNLLHLEEVVSSVDLEVEEECSEVQPQPNLLQAAYLEVQLLLNSEEADYSEVKLSNHREDCLEAEGLLNQQEAAYLELLLLPLLQVVVFSEVKQRSRKEAYLEAWRHKPVKQEEDSSVVILKQEEQEACSHRRLKAVVVYLEANLLKQVPPPAGCLEDHSLKPEAVDYSAHHSQQLGEAFLMEFLQAKDSQHQEDYSAHQHRSHKDQASFRQRKQVLQACTQRDPANRWLEHIPDTQAASMPAWHRC